MNFIERASQLIAWRLSPVRAGGVGKAPEQVGIILTPTQAEIRALLEQGNKAIVPKGRRAGGTRLGGHRFVEALQDKEGGRGYLLVAPTLETCRRVFDETKDIARACALHLGEKQSPYPTLYSPTGSWLTARSVTSSVDLGLQLRGLGKHIYGVMVDEGAFLPPWAWKVIRPVMTDNDAWLYFTGTTHGEGLFKMLYDWGLDPGRPDYYSRRMPTSSNTFLSEEQIRELTEDVLPEDRPAELDALFVPRSGLVFIHFRRDVHTRVAFTEGQPMYGVDWGFTNPAVVLAMVQGGDRVQVLGEFYRSGCTPDQHVEAAKAMQERYGRGLCYCDPSRPEMITAFQRAGIPATGAKNELLPGLDHLRKLLGNYEGVEPRLFVSPECTNLLREMAEYAYPERGGEEPRKENDHAIDSLRYACYSSRGGVSRQVRSRRYRE